MATSRPSSSATTCSPTRRSGGLATGSRRRSGRTPTTTVTRGRRRTTAGRWWKPQTGSTFVGYENPLGVTTAEQCVRSFLASDRADWYRHVNVTAHDHGGHFIPWELPTEWVDECAGPSADSADRRRLRLVRLLSVVMVETESADSWPSTSCFPPSAGTRSAIAPMVMPLHTPSPTYSVPPTRMSQSSRPVKSGDWTQQWVQGSPMRQHPAATQPVLQAADLRFRVVELRVCGFKT
jgi:hypothetical protein